MAAVDAARRPARPARAPGADRRARPRGRELLVVLEVVDVLLDRRADDLPARVRLRLRLARQQGRRLRLRRVRRHRHGRDGGALLERFPAMFGTFVKYQFQRTYDAILAAPVDTEELVTAEALWIATRAGVYGCVPMLVAIAFGLDPSWGMLAVPLIALDLGLRLGVLRDHDRGLRQVDRELQLRRQRRADAALPRRRHVLPDQQPARAGRSSSRTSTRSTTASSSSATPRSASRAGDLGRVGALVVFGLIMWRVAIHAMTRKLID